MIKFIIFTAFVVLFCLVELAESQAKSPRGFVKSKCVKRIKNETLLEKCKSCVEQYSLTEYPTKNEVRALIRECVPRKDPKEWVKGKCEENTEKQGDVEICFQCVDDFVLPKNITRDDVQAMRKACLQQPSLKFRAKRKCVKRFRNKGEIETCHACIQSFKLSDKPSCEEVNDMKRQCITETGRSGRDLWSEPILQDEEEEESV